MQGLSTSKHRQLLYTAGGLRDDLRLLEVDESMLKHIAEAGVVIKGGEHDDLVMCTHDTTYALKYVETTNTLLLLPPDQDGDQAFAALPSQAQGQAGSQDASAARDTGLQTQMAKAAKAADAPPLVAMATAIAHIEVVPIAPKLGKLPLLLAEQPYGEADEQAEQRRRGAAGQPPGSTDAQPADAGGQQGAPGRRGYTFEQLRALVQASDAELAAALRSTGALQVGGAWRLVDASYMGELLELLLVSAQAHGWPLDRIPRQQLVDTLAADGYNAAVVAHCLAAHGSPCRGDGPPPEGGAPASPSGAAPMDEDGAPTCYALDETKVCVHFARKLLSQRQAWQLAELMGAWREAVPPPFAVRRAMLRGEAITTDVPPPGARTSTAGGPDTWPADARVVALPAAGLPLEPEARFAALFATRERWDKRELDPYLEGMQVGPGQTASALLLKYTRNSQASADAPIILSLRSG